MIARLLFLVCLFAGTVAAQSAPRRKDIPAIAKAANGSIVSIVMSDKDGKPIAQGSGFLVRKDGVIVTNYHVISEGRSAIVKFPDGAFYVVDGVLASDKARDVAVIKAQGENFRALTFGNSDRLQVGEEVVAIGNPLSLESTVSSGIISGIRTIKEEGGKFLQITAPISPGSSGGPLFNMAGEVIGITTLYLKGGENLNFAIPVNDAKRLLSNQSTKLQKLPDEERAPEESPQGASVSEILTWIALHFETLTFKDYNQTDTYTTDTHISFSGCQVTVKGYTHPPTNDQHNLGDSILTDGPFNLGDFNPNGIRLESFNALADGSNSFRLRLFSVQPFLFTEVLGGTTIPSIREPDAHNFSLLFTTKDMAERQQKAWHTAITLCGGKKTKDDLY
jgi:hypothetical protein